MTPPHVAVLSVISNKKNGAFGARAIAHSSLAEVLYSLIWLFKSMLRSIGPPPQDSTDTARASQSFSPPASWGGAEVSAACVKQAVRLFVLFASSAWSPRYDCRASFARVAGARRLFLATLAKAAAAAEGADTK